MSSIQLIHTNDALSTRETDFNHEQHPNSEDSGLTAEQLIMEMEHVEPTGIMTGTSFSTWPLDSLIDYMIKVHHRRVRQNAVIIYNLAEKAAYRHGGTHPNLPKLVTSLFLFLDDLLHHFKKEEQILFPNIRQLVRTKNHIGETEYTIWGLVKGSTESMRREHIAMDAELKDFRKLTNDFTPPEDACHCHTDLFTKMEEFESDLSLHINLENEILFPQAILLVEEYKKQDENRIDERIFQ